MMGKPDVEVSNYEKIRNTALKAVEQHSEIPGERFQWHVSQSALIEFQKSVTYVGFLYNSLSPLFGFSDKTLRGAVQINGNQMVYLDESLGNGIAELVADDYPYTAAELYRTIDHAAARDLYVVDYRTKLWFT